jgi:hypothetical protein
MGTTTPLDRTAAPGRLGDLLRNVISLLSLGAGAIHFAVIQSHFEEYWLSGLFFAVVAWLQVLWAILIVANPTRLMALAGAAINGAVVVVWVLSRTAGIPFGPEAGTPEEAQFVDVVATSFEFLIVVGALAVASSRLATLSLSRASTLAGTVLVLGVVTILTVTAVNSFSPEHGSEPEETQEQHDEEQSGQSAMMKERITGAARSR